MADTAADQMLVDNKVFVELKGAFTEQFVAQELVSMCIKPYYWSNDRTPAEIDFVVQQDGKAIPIEVKAFFTFRYFILFLLYLPIEQRYKVFPIWLYIYNLF